MFSLIDKGWADWINKATNGRLKVTVVDPNSSFPNAEAVQNIGKGTIEACFTSSGYAGGIMPETSIAGSLPFTWTTNALAQDWFYNYGGQDLIQEAYSERNVISIPVIYQQPTNIGTMFECKSPNDLKGKKIRTYGAMAKYVEAVGGSPVNMAVADIYMGLKLKTVDAFCGGVVNLETAKLKEVVKGYVVEPTCLTPTDAIIINKDAFNALPKDMQDIITRDSRYYLAYAANTLQQQLNYSINKASQDYGLQVYTWSAEDTKALRVLMAQKVWPEFAAPNARCKKMVDSITSHLKAFGLL